MLISWDFVRSYANVVCLVCDVWLERHLWRNFLGHWLFFGFKRLLAGASCVDLRRCWLILTNWTDTASIVCHTDWLWVKIILGKSNAWLSFARLRYVGLWSLCWLIQTLILGLIHRISILLALVYLAWCVGLFLLDTAAVLTRRLCQELGALVVLIVVCNLLTCWHGPGRDRAILSCGRRCDTIIILLLAIGSHWAFLLLLLLVQFWTFQFWDQVWILGVVVHLLRWVIQINEVVLVCVLFAQHSFVVLGLISPTESLVSLSIIDWVVQRNGWVLLRIQKSVSKYHFVVV